jgi:outer membrane protein OmpA-like peptidoglycan-associated protein
MHVRNALIVVSSLLFLSSLTPLAKAQAEEMDSIKEQMAQVAQEKAEIAKEEAELEREAVALDERIAALAVRKDALARREDEIMKAAVARTQQLEAELAYFKAKETERGLVLTLGDVLFEYNEADLRADTLQKLYVLVTYLKEHPDRNVLIEGHTDSTGTETYNLELSQRRATAVRTFLARNGIDPGRLTTRGYGQAQPVASNATAAGRQENRRVEIVILHEGERVAERMP